MKKLLDTISRAPSFSGLPESQLEELRDIAGDRHFNKKDKMNQTATNAIDHDLIARFKAGSMDAMEKIGDG